MLHGIWAIALTTLRHCVRSRVVLLGVVAYIAAMGLCLLFAPRPVTATVEVSTGGEGGAFDAERAALSPEGERIRFIQSTSVGVAFFFGIAITALVAATWLPSQVRGGELGPVLSKPVGRIRAVLGTLLGFWLLLVLLYAAYAVCGAGTLRLAAILSQDRRESARQLQTIHMVAASDFGGKHSEAGADGGKARLTSQGQSAFWRFDAVRFTGGERGGDLIHCQFIGEIQKSDNPFVNHPDLLVTLREPEGGRVLQQARINNVKSGRMAEFTLKRSTLPQGGFEITVSPAVPGYQVVCYPRGLGVITGTGGFEWNYLKTFGLSLIGLTVFLALTVAGSTLLTPNVSIFFATGAGMAGACMSFLREYVETRYTATSLTAPLVPGEGVHPFLGGLRTGAGAFGESAFATVLQAASDIIGTVTFGAVPDWSRFDSVNLLLNRVAVPARTFGPSLLYAGIYCAVCVVLGSVIFGRRELK